MTKLNFKNKKFGNLTAIKSLGKPYWLFKCDCGNEIIKNPQHIKKRKIENLHCGCKNNYKSKTLKRIKKNITINQNGCWIWQKSKDRYGNIQYKGKNCKVHRVVYEIYFGEFNPNLYVCHKCDNGICCNPEHLFLGTQKDNMIDMARKKRSTLGKKASLKVKQKMSLSQKNRWKNKNYYSFMKLKEKDIYKIKTMLKEGISQRKIADLFKISQGHVSRINLGITWKHI